MKERTPRSLRDAFPEDYEPVINTDPIKFDTFTAAIGAVLAVVVALVLGITIYFWSH